MPKQPLKYWAAIRKRPGLALAFDAAVIIVAFVLIHAWNTRQLPHGDAVPELALIQLGSSVVEQQLPKGSTGVVYFFAPWCFYCRNSIDNLDKLVANGDIAWARAVALDYESLESVHQFIAETGLTQPVLLGNRHTATDWGVRAFPTYFVIDANGNITSRSVGYSTSLGLWARSKLAN
jgi:peroxiredoxin